MSRRDDVLLLGAVGLERAPRVARGVANGAGEVLLATLYVGTRFRTGRIIAVGSIDTRDSCTLKSGQLSAQIRGI